MITETKKRDVALVVDDSPETLRLLTDALDGAGMTVMVALDGASAMRIVDHMILPWRLTASRKRPETSRAARALCVSRALARCTRIRASISSITIGFVT